MRLFSRERGAVSGDVNLDGFVYWPACPTCGASVGCVRRHPENAVPAERYDFRCKNEHASTFTHAEIMAMQDRRRREVG